MSSPMSSSRAAFIACLCTGALGACASNGLETDATAGFTQAASAESGEAASQSSNGTAAPASGDVAYVVAAGERELDCKKLTGRIQIRILELRPTPPAGTLRRCRDRCKPPAKRSLAAPWPVSIRKANTPSKWPKWRPITGNSWRATAGRSISPRNSPRPIHQRRPSRRHPNLP